MHTRLRKIVQLLDKAAKNLVGGDLKDSDDFREAFIMLDDTSDLLDPDVFGASNESGLCLVRVGFGSLRILASINPSPQLMHLVVGNFLQNAKTLIANHKVDGRIDELNELISNYEVDRFDNYASISVYFFA